MSKYAIALIPLIAAVALLSLGQAAAGPSPRVSERMTREVFDDLRTYDKEKDPKRRLAILERLAQTKDPRVIVALVDAANNSKGDDLDCEAADLLWWFFACADAANHRRPIRADDILPHPGQGYRRWWSAHEVDIRRQAARLPR
jgi:hypothetical protein